MLGDVQAKPSQYPFKRPLESNSCQRSIRKYLKKSQMIIICKKTFHKTLIDEERDAEHLL